MPQKNSRARRRACAHKAAHSIAVFLSFDGELDTGPLIEQLWTLGKRVYLPVLHPFSPGHLLFLRYAPETPLVRNRFNILEPRLDVRQVLPLGELDVVLTPLVAFDHTGQRLGMGAVLRSHPAKLAQRRPIPSGWPMIASRWSTCRPSTGISAAGNPHPALQLGLART